MAFIGSPMINKDDENHVAVRTSMVRIGDVATGLYIYIHFHDLAQMITIAKEIQRQAEELMKKQGEKNADTTIQD